MDRNLNILLTGASGYIGSRWLEHPSRHVASVTALVRNTAVYDPQKDTAPSSVTVHVREGVIPTVDPGELLDGMDAVLHFAAQTPEKIDADLIQVNLKWTERLAHACATRGVRLLFPSTGSVYGGRTGELFAEDTPNIHPWGEYAVSKYRAEEVLRATPHLSYAVLRFGSVFGYARRMNAHTAVNAFVGQAARAEAILVWKGVFDQLRPYTHIDDCVSAINYIIDNDLFNGLVYNVVSENQTMRVILEYIHRHMLHATIKIIESDRMNDLSFGMDDGRIRALGFVPKGTLSEGIAALFAAYPVRAV